MMEKRRSPRYDSLRGAARKLGWLAWLLSTVLSPPIFSSGFSLSIFSEGDGAVL
jgi:hypothetical protein